MTETILTVLTPATSYDLATLTTIKDELGITDTASDTLLARWISESSDQIAAYTERVWGQETITELFRHTHVPFDTGFTHGRRSRRHALSLARWPIASIASIVEDDTTTLVQDVDYEIDPPSGLVYRLFDGQPWSWQRRKVFVTYTAGYLLPDTAPLRVQQACQMLVKGRWSSRTRDPSLRSFNIPGVIEKTFWTPSAGDSDMPPEVAGLLDPISSRSF